MSLQFQIHTGICITGASFSLLRISKIDFSIRRHWAESFFISYTTLLLEYRYILICSIKCFCLPMYVHTEVIYHLLFQRNFGLIQLLTKDYTEIQLVISLPECFVILHQNYFLQILSDNLGNLCKINFYLIFSSFLRLFSK